MLQSREIVTANILPTLPKAEFDEYARMFNLCVGAK